MPDPASPDQPAAGRLPSWPGEFSLDALTFAPTHSTLAGARPELSPPPELPGYDILEEIGRGGMGVVYRARQRGLNRLVALKMMLAGAQAGPQDLARFRLEAEAVARLAHPNIVQVHEVGDCQGRLFLALEHVGGGSLAERLKAGPLPPREAARLVADLSRGVHAAHQAGIIHRDLKPANILLGSPGSSVLSPQEGDAAALRPRTEDSGLRTSTPKIADFGLAKRAEGSSGLTQSGMIVGTPSHMAPEQAAGRADGVGTLADVYGLGAILFECLTGRPPFQGATPMETVLHVLHDPPPSPRDLNPRVDRDLALVCLTCLAKEPKGRYGSAEALAADLERWLAGQPIAIHPPRLGQAVRSWLRQNFGAAGWTLPIGLGYGLATALLIWVWGMERSFIAHGETFGSLPSEDAPWVAGLALRGRVSYPVFFLTLFTAMTSMGWLLARLVRPRDAQADLAVGLVAGFLASVLLFFSAGTWFMEEDVATVVGRKFRPILETASLHLPPGEAGATVRREREAAAWAALPALAGVPAERRPALLNRLLHAQIATRVPRALATAFAFSVACGLSFSVAGAVIGGAAWRRHPGLARGLLAYFEMMLPAAFLISELVTRFLAWYTPRLEVTRRPLDSAVVLVLQATALTAAAHRWNGWLRFALFLAWFGFFLASNYLGLELPSWKPFVR